MGARGIDTFFYDRSCVPPHTRLLWGLTVLGSLEITSLETIFDIPDVIIQAKFIKGIHGHDSSRQQVLAWHSLFFSSIAKFDT
jgi:hypothetical protein